MKNTSKIIIALIAIAAVAVVAAFLFAGKESGKDTSSNEDTSETAVTEDNQDYVMPEEVVLEDDPTTKDYDNGINFDEEIEDAEIEYKKSSVDDFIGSWEATSGQSAYFYGNVDLTINPDGTWTGNITEEPLKGKWKEQGGGIYLTSEIFNCNLTFTADGTLIMQEDYEDTDDEAVLVVLTHK